ncbi:MAG: AraC family transcriptional regulator [Bacillota bacterium]
MIKLDVKEYQQLVLKNVLMKKYQAIAVEKTHEKFHAFVSQTEKKQIKMYGPLVTIKDETTIHTDGTLLTDYALLIQAHDYQEHQEHYIIKDRIELPKCVALKYKGPAELIHYAQAKLDLYLHNHHLQTTGEVITVLINEMSDCIEADILKPVV